jgi:TonB family protein
MLHRPWCSALKKSGSRISQGGWSRLRLALGCTWATHVIAREYPLLKPATASPAAAQSLSGELRHGASPFSRRMIALLLIACLHGIAIYALASALVRTAAVHPPSATEATVLTESQPRQIPPAVPAPHLRQEEIEIPSTEFTIAPPTDPPPIGPTGIEPTQRSGSSQPGRTALARVPGGPDAGFPNTDDYYPSAARRVGESGVAAVRVCVDARGRLNADPRLIASSGSSRLDQASLRLAKAGSGHYRPTTEDGQTVSDCYSFRVRFQLRD